MFPPGCFQWLHKKFSWNSLRVLDHLWTIYDNLILLDFLRKFKHWRQAMVLGWESSGYNYHDGWLDCLFLSRAYLSLVIFANSLVKPSGLSAYTLAQKENSQLTISFIFWYHLADPDCAIEPVFTSIDLYSNGKDTNRRQSGVDPVQVLLACCNISKGTASLTSSSVAVVSYVNCLDCFGNVGPGNFGSVIIFLGSHMFFEYFRKNKVGRERAKWFWVFARFYDVLCVVY